MRSMAGEEDDFKETVWKLYQEKRFKEVLNLPLTVDTNTYFKNFTRINWIWPSVENIRFIQENLFEYNLAGITSIGCGRGLFEWLIETTAGVKIRGLEVNRKWWQSKYAFPVFLCHDYADEMSAIEIDPKTALLFCYFNSRKFFLDYLQIYDGPMVIIAGPKDGRGTHTDPTPFEPKFPDNADNLWQMIGSQEVRQTKDHVAIYVRKQR